LGELTPTIGGDASATIEGLRESDLIESSHQPVERRLADRAEVSQPTAEFTRAERDG
jgi:hypothetical protein